MGECLVAAVLNSNGIHYRQQIFVGYSIYDDPPHYRHRLRVDFVVSNLARFPHGLILESKYQNRRGSVDEKLPYIRDNVRAGSYPHPLIVITHGQGFRHGATSGLDGVWMAST